MMASGFPLLEAAMLCHHSDLCQVLMLSTLASQFCMPCVPSDLCEEHQIQISRSGAISIVASCLQVIIHRADEQRVMTTGTVSKRMLHKPVVPRESEQPDSRLR